MNARLGVCAVAAIAVVLASSAAGGTSARPGIFRGEGTIVFACQGCPQRGSSLQLFTISASGRGFRQRPTDAPGPYWPRWSPDGRSVVFAAHGTDIWRLAISPPGRGLRLTRKCRSCGPDSHPAWSPDGRTIGFVRERALYTVRAFNGTQLRELWTGHTGSLESLDWSPDGRRIAFNLGSAIYVARSDGRRARRILPRNPGGSHPRWSPDSSRIAFIGWRGRSAVMVVRRDGTGLRVVAAPPTLDHTVNPTWSPDGRHILFVVRHVFDHENVIAGREFWVVPVAGGPVRRIAIAQLPRTRSAEIYGVDWTRRALSS